MRKAAKRDQHAQRIKRNATKKAKRARAQKEFEQGDWQVSRRREAKARLLRANRLGDAVAMMALVGLERPR